MSEKPDGQLIQSDALLGSAFLSAVIPGIASYFSSNLAFLADGILVGRYVGIDGLAAVGLCGPVFQVLSLVGNFLACGGETVAAKALGKNQEELAQRMYSAHLTLSLGFSLLFTLVGLFLSTPVAAFLSGGDVTLTPLVREYSWIYFLGAGAVILTCPPFWFLPLEGKNKEVTIMMVIMGGGNILLDIFFLAKLGLGVQGAALASVLSSGASAAYGMYVLHHGKHSFQLQLALPQSRKEWMELTAAGSPEAFTNLFQTLRMLTVNNFLLRLGSNHMVAQFAVISAITSLTDAVTVGVPQSGSAIMGVYCGEQDNGSAMILLEQQFRIGVIGCVVFALMLGFGAPVVEWAYQVEGLTGPLVSLAISLIPALGINVVNSYYRVSGREMLANLLIAMRYFGFSLLSMMFLNAVGLSLWLFLLLEVLLTLGLWAAITWLIKKLDKKKPLSRWLLMNLTLEKQGRSINFSSPADPEAICSASERIGDFCAENDMAPKQTMRVSLALEEMMTLITQFNPDQTMSFDVRVFSVPGVIGIRIRYGGIDFNPLDEEYAEDERFMGVVMVRHLVETVVYQRTFGVNSLLILIE